MKAVIAVGAFLLIILLLNWPYGRKPLTEGLATANNEVAKVISAPTIAGIEEINKRAIEQAEIGRKRADDAQLTKVFIPGRTVKECMRAYGSDQITNRIVDCNKDRTLSMRKDEVEKFKQQEGLL